MFVFKFSPVIIMFMFLLCPTDQTMMHGREGIDEALKNANELVDSAKDLFNRQGSFEGNLAFDWLSKHNPVDFLCHGKFEIQSNESLKKLHNNLCEKLENGKGMDLTVENVQEMITKIEIPKADFNNKQIGKWYGEIAILDGKNQENYAKLVKLSTIGLDKFHQTIKAMNLRPFFQNTKSIIKNKRQKRMDIERANRENSDKRCKCWAAITGAIISGAILAGSITLLVKVPNSVSISLVFDFLVLSVLLLLNCLCTMLIYCWS